MNRGARKDHFGLNVQNSELEGGCESEVLSRKGFRNGREGQRLVPKDVGGVGETSPRDSPSKEGDHSGSNPS